MHREENIWQANCAQHMREQICREMSGCYLSFLVNHADIRLSLYTERPSRRWLVGDGIAAVRCLQLIPATTGRYSNESFSRKATEEEMLCFDGKQYNGLIARGQNIIYQPVYVRL